ncbi:protein FAR1-RELATED SEQUENCE 5-like [Lolium perenne]|uniref:protein FAR1-RELATED SEQUENCE 5-like n=1 Tax=Lolium perenne TaxID=4522 RepID=UPI0021F609EC|nr:protein FAR1-RELATED SEQUENCE 5-like [Lolium perenne]
MDTTKANESGKTQQEDVTTAAESIFGSMTGKTPIQCRRMVDKFAQAFLQRRKERVELKSLAELQAVEESFYMHKQNSEAEGHTSSNITRASKQKCKDFDLNEVLKFENEDNEGYADSNIPEMHADGASFAGENACPADNADYSNGDEHGNKEDEKYEEILESVLNPEEPTAEELEMDRMFANKKYPTMQEISEASTPTVGMEFDSKDDAFFFFAAYARRVGFAIKKDTSYESRKTNEITRQTFACNRCRDDTYVDSALRQRRTSRIVQTKCKVRMFVKEYRGKWSISNIRLEHNHNLAPSEWIVRFMKCHRSMSASDKTLIHILQETRVPPRNIMKIFRKTRGSFRAVPFDTKNLENELAKERKKIEELLLLFKEAREKMPGFRHSLDVDSDNRVKIIFWTDQIGRENYSKFGQFVSFDTTFSTNQYGMPFAPILGVDNYGKTVVFGVGLLEDERADTFKWLFEEFLSAMDNKHPETIITDQDVAMRIAISKALPYTVHRFYNFHISKNLDDKLSLFFAVRGTLKEELRAVIRNSFTPEEFENSWHDLLERHNTSGEPHLDRIYDIRAQWVPAYFKERFFPFTSSTGRSESTNSLFKHYIKRKDSIATFFKEYIIIQEKKQSDLDRLREKSEFKESVNWGFNPLEREAMKIYTDPIYGKFAEELRKGTAYNVEVVEEKRIYRVIRVTNYRNAEFPR